MEELRRLTISQSKKQEDPGEKWDLQSPLGCWQNRTALRSSICSLCPKRNGSRQQQQQKTPNQKDFKAKQNWMVKQPPYPPKKQPSRAGERAQRVKDIAAKPNRCSSVPRIWFLQAALWPPHACYGIYMPVPPPSPTLNKQMGERQA